MKKIKKFQLSKETILRLTDRELGQVAGQYPGNTGSVCSNCQACNSVTCFC